MHPRSGPQVSFFRTLRRRQRGHSAQPGANRSGRRHPACAGAGFRFPYAWTAPASEKVSPTASNAPACDQTFTIEEQLPRKEPVQ